MQAISKIISQGAHNRDQDATKFAEQLMTDLEAVRQSNDLTASDREILESEEKSQDFVLKFATSVLARAQSQIAQHTVTQATAMTLVAASTFFDLVDLWPGSDQSEQIKFAKYHAARILKAVQQGEDPNDLYEDHSELEQELDALVKGENEGQKLDSDGYAGGDASRGADADGDSDTNEDIDAETETRENLGAGEVSASTDTPANEAQFSGSPTTSLPSAPNDSPKVSQDAPSSPSSTLPSVPGEVPGHRLPETPNKQPNNLGLPEAPEEQPGIVFEYERPPPAPKLEEFENDQIQGSQIPRALPKVVNDRPAPDTAAAPTDIASILSQAEVTKKAQKHAKFAISALNYDDYTTAIAELEGALKVLRAAGQ